MNKKFRRDLAIAVVGAVSGAVITGLFSLGISYQQNVSIQESIVESLSAHFKSVDKDMSYEQALEAVYKENKDIKKELNELKDKNNQENIDKEIKQIIQEAMEYGKSSDYIQALSILNSAENKTSEIEALINNYSQKYESYIVEQVNSLISDEKLDEANSLVENALNVIPNSKKIKDKQKEIQDSYPQNMLEVIPAYQSGGNTYTEYIANNSGSTEYFTMGGIKYTNGMTFDADINIFDDISWAIYNLNKKYNNLRFTICHVDGSDNGDNSSLQVFYDGNLKEEISLSPDMSPKDISLNVSGVTQLKLQVPSSGSNHPLYGVGNPTLK